MFRSHVDHSCRRAFFTGIILYPVVILVGVFTDYAMALAAGFSISFAVQLLVFSISLSILERTPKEG
jgi:hypothetical protein